ncbi:DUF6624 domain-containing protein [Brevundimonas sp. NIBR11]|uniref:DUF6624 domain-containing protein n=1 Tax=Brevundimonas sp. NIBR11 TaxID=3015999 RepID=UPI0022EFE29F|nr:DUF6624 domain-containing protein [Brevundimonas sp. NIBR11]WGM32919.1 hypothetical protein KKHFBJBL_03175 [Brevundimonas sp. NIBR11]
MSIWILTALLMTGDLSPEARARLAAFDRAVAESRRAYDGLGADATDRQRLEALLVRDQRPMSIASHEIDLSGLPEAERREARALVDAEIDRLSDENVEALLTMVPAEGWFSIAVYGEEAATSAFLIVQHADTALQKRFLPAIEAMANRGEASKSFYAMMWDRVAVAEGRPQRWGTQMQCVDGFMRPFPTEDPERLEERRAPMGFRWPDYAGYLANFGACGSH